MAEDRGEYETEYAAIRLPARDFGGPVTSEPSISSTTETSTPQRARLQIDVMTAQCGRSPRRRRIPPSALPASHPEDLCQREVSGQVR